MDVMSVHGNAECQHFVQFLGNDGSVFEAIGYGKQHRVANKEWPGILLRIPDSGGPELQARILLVWPSLSPRPTPGALTP
jgi:hypothetical protein